MSYWPLDLKYGVDNPVTIDVHGAPMRLAPLNATTLEYAHGDSDPKVVGVSAEANVVRLVPTIGPQPLLVFPRRTLLCPANSMLKTVLRLPLFIRVGVGTTKDVREIAIIKPPSTSRALYGPVDAGALCTSVKSDVGVTIDGLRAHAADDSISSATRVGQNSGDDPEMSREDSRSLSEHDLVAFADLTITNETDEPKEVAKVMIPHDQLVLFEADQVTRTSHLKMRLLSESEAELDFGPCPDTEASPIPDLRGRVPTSDGRKHLFDLTYRNKTGLEYGF